MNNIIDYKMIGNRIQQARKVKGCTQETLCADLNISKYHYSKIENAHVSASLETLVEIANYLQIDIEYLLSGSSKLNKQYLEGEMNEIFNKCDHHQKRLIIEIAKTIAKSDIKSVPNVK